MDLHVDVHNIGRLRAWAAAHYPVIRLDPNNACNLHCVYCHNTRSDRIVDLGELRAFLAENVLGSRYFQVGCAMEPTLDRRLAEVISIIGQSPARPSDALVLQTNGLLLHRHDAGQMAADGLTSLSVSLDTADPSMQRELRGGMSLAKAIRNIEAFRADAPAVALELIGVVTRQNIGAVQSLVDLAISLGAHRIILREVLYYPDNKVVDHTRMPDLVLRPGEFAAMQSEIVAAFCGRIDLVFAPVERLHKSAIEMSHDSDERAPLSPASASAP